MSREGDHLSLTFSLSHLTLKSQKSLNGSTLNNIPHTAPADFTNTRPTPIKTSAGCGRGGDYEIPRPVFTLTAQEKRDGGGKSAGIWHEQPLTKPPRPTHEGSVGGEGRRWHFQKQTVEREEQNQRPLSPSPKRSQNHDLDQLWAEERSETHRGRGISGKGSGKKNQDWTKSKYGLIQT